MALTADHLIIIGRGRLLANTTKAFVEANSRKDVLVRSPHADALAGLLVGAGGEVVTEDDGALSVTGIEASAIGELKFSGQQPHRHPRADPSARIVGGRLPRPHA